MGTLKEQVEAKPVTAARGGGSAAMRIAFLCISLEPGRDGVGDYVRQLSLALAARGHDCQAIALADRFAAVAHEDSEPRAGVQIVRVPAESWQSGDIAFAAERLARFAPDWVSLQMVCYGFERWGLLMRSSSRFARLRAAARRHMMFHELWIGESVRSPAKDRVIGSMQKHLLLRATRAWSPEVVHTSNALYCELLRRGGIRAAELPLPGNIALCDIAQAQAREQLVRRIAADSSSAERLLLAGIFGSIHAEWVESDWLERLEAVCRTLDRRLALVQLGRAGAVGLRVLAELRRRMSDRVTLVQLGELPVPEVSAVLLGLDFGIATSPWPLIGKSGSIAAMLEHGVPVLVTRSDFRLRSGPTSEPASHPLLLRLDEFLARLRAGALVRMPPQRRMDSYEIFERALQRDRHVR